MLILGGFCKVFPLLIVLPYILVSERELRPRLKYLAISGGIIIAVYLILSRTTEWEIKAVIDAAEPMMADFSVRMMNLARKMGFSVSYGLFLLYLFFRNRQSEKDYIAVFLIPLLILFTFQPIGFRYWIWISPMVALYLSVHRGH